MKKIKIITSVFILLFINFLFSYKYLLRYFDFGIYISIGLLIIQLLAYNLSSKILISIKLKNFFSYSLLVLIVGLVVFSYLKIPIESLNVDRWSVVSSFFKEAFNGNYPGPMPIYFLIALPFYLIGELSLLSCLGYCIIVVLIIKKTKQTQNLQFLLFFLSTSLFLIWEITTRSNLLTFTVLALLPLNEYTKLNNKGVKFYIFAVLTGLLLSTRSVYVLAYIIFFLSSLLNKEDSFKKLFTFLSIALIAFIITFLPFIVYFKNDFFVMNPFIVQSSFLIPQFYTFIFILISFLFAFLVKNRIDKFFYSGLVLFTSILIYSIYNLVNYGFEMSFFDSKIDISYFIFSIPFFIMYLIESDGNKDTQLNKA